MSGLDVPAFLIAVLLIVGGAGVARWVAGRLGQPKVLGEIVLGILVGPTLLGRAWPAAHDAILGPAALPVLEALSTIGLVLFMYLVGSELRWSRSDGLPTFLIAFGGLLIPFGLGTMLALAVPTWFFSNGPTFAELTILGVILSVSALAVLARLLRDLGLGSTRLGALAMGAATIDDVVGWILLGLVAGIGTVGLLGNVALNAVALALVALGALALDRYLAPRFAADANERAPLLFVWLLVGVFASALLTHWAGLHAVIGPFVVGAIVSRHAALREYARVKLGEITVVLLLPAFFVLSGATVDLRLLANPTGIAAVAAILVVATVGKLAGVYSGARAAGLDGRSALQLGVLLNARGAIGLVVARVAEQSGLVTPRGYAAIVVMILASTLAAPIVLRALLPRNRRGPETPSAAP